MAKNIYLRSLVALVSSMDKVALMILATHLQNGNIVVMGETFGQGIQDLGYSTKPKFLAFDLVHNGLVCEYGKFEAHLILLDWSGVPVLYRGRYGDAPLDQLRDGKSTLDGQTLKEGIVIRDDLNTDTGFIGRKMLKMVSPDYLTRKSKDATEYQ